MCAVCARNSGSKWASMTDSSSACVGVVKETYGHERALRKWNVESVRKVLWLLFTLWSQSLLLGLEISSCLRKASFFF